MNLHSLSQYLKYRTKAKGLHGTHSPFVYAFVENVIRGKREFAADDNIISPFKESRHKALLEKIAACYDYKDILDLQQAIYYDLQPRLYDMVIFRDNRIEDWLHTLHKFRFPIREEGVIVVPGIHATKDRTAAWNKLRADGAVKMSIDLYDVGLLFFRTDFKIKQHFVLKYR